TFPFRVTMLQNHSFNNLKSCIMEKTNQSMAHSSQTLASEKGAINFKQPYLVTGETLLPLLPDYSLSDSAVEKKFRSAKELEELVFKNGKTLFRPHTVTVALQKKDGAL